MGSGQAQTRFQFQGADDSGQPAVSELGLAGRVERRQARGRDKPPLPMLGPCPGPDSITTVRAFVFNRADLFDPRPKTVADDACPPASFGQGFLRAGRRYSGRNCPWPCRPSWRHVRRAANRGRPPGMSTRGRPTRLQRSIRPGPAPIIRTSASSINQVPVRR